MSDQARDDRPTQPVYHIPPDEFELLKAAHKKMQADADRGNTVVQGWLGWPARPGAATSHNAKPIIFTDEKEPPTIWYHGEDSYSADGRVQYPVSASQHRVLQLFLNCDRKRRTRDIEKDAHVSNVSRIMNELAKLSEQFRAAIERPGPGNKGGYFIRVRPAKSVGKT